MAFFGQQARRVAYSPDRTDNSNGDDRPKHTIRRISRSAALPVFIEALEEDGCVVIKNFTDLDTLERANEEVRPWLEKMGDGPKVGALQGKTRMVTSLIRHSPTVREKFYADSLHQDLCEHFLALKTTCWYGDEASTNVSHPLLSVAMTFDIPPGTSAQKLHRDDKNHHGKHRKVKQYENGRDILLMLFVAGCDTSKENGATRVVPGSHLWGDEKPDFGKDGTRGVVDAELKKGEAFIMLGSLYHGGGAYEKPIRYDGKPESRTVHAMFTCTGVHRTEEVNFLTYPIEEVKTYSKVVQDRLGFRQSEPNLGWVGFKSPEFLLTS